MTSDPDWHNSYPFIFTGSYAEWRSLGVNSFVLDVCDTFIR